jgi:hypothetical protein
MKHTYAKNGRLYHSTLAQVMNALLVDETQHMRIDYSNSLIRTV